MKIAKRQYYNNYFSVNVKDSKKIWNGIKEIIKVKPNTSQKTIRIVENNVEIKDLKMIVNVINNYFSYIGKNLANEIPDVQNSPFDYLKNTAKVVFSCSQ